MASLLDITDMEPNATTTSSGSWTRTRFGDFNFGHFVWKTVKANDSSNRTFRNFHLNFSQVNLPTICGGIESPYTYTIFIALGCVLAVICIVGIVANIISIVVFSRMPQRSSTTFLIQMLAVADSVFLLSNLFTWTLYSWFHALGHLCLYLQYMSRVLPYFKGIMEVARDASVWMVAMVTVDRYVALYYPLSMSRFCRVSVIARILALLFLYVVAFNVPSFMQFTTVGTSFTLGHRQKIAAFSLSSLNSNLVYNVTYYSVDSVMNLLLPVFIVLILNFRIIMVLKRARTTRSLLSRNSSEVDRGSFATVMLVIIAIVFVVCELPKVAESYFIIWSKWERSNEVGMRKKTRAGHEANFILFIISTLTQAFNSFVNFFVYCLTARRFRKVLKKIVPLMTCRMDCYRYHEKESEPTPL